MPSSAILLINQLHQMMLPWLPPRHHLRHQNLHLACLHHHHHHHWWPIHQNDLLSLQHLVPLLNVVIETKSHQPSIVPKNKKTCAQWQINWHKWQRRMHPCSINCNKHWKTMKLYGDFVNPWWLLINSSSQQHDFHHQCSYPIHQHILHLLKYFPLYAHHVYVLTPCI